ncbi:MAG: hypothetical protein AAF513_20345 [Pseudomonadota bacterium]
MLRNNRCAMSAPEISLRELGAADLAAVAGAGNNQAPVDLYAQSPGNLNAVVGAGAPPLTSALIWHYRVWPKELPQ